MKRGIIIFFSFWYLVPGLFTLWQPEFIQDLFRGNVYVHSLFYAAVFFWVTYYFTKVRPSMIAPPGMKFFGLIFHSKVEYAVIVVFFSSSLIFSARHGLAFRQTGEMVSEAGSLVYLSYVTKSYVKCFILKQIVLVSQKNYRLPLFKLSLAFIGSIASTVAALDVLMPIIIAGIILRRGEFYQGLSLRFSNLKVGKVIYIVLISLSLFLVPLIGYANKYGFANSFDTFTEEATETAGSVMRRIATWHHAVNIYSDDVGVEGYRDHLRLIKDISSTSLNRISILFGGERDIPEVHTAARYNYLRLFHDTNNPRTGATSGIVAASLLFFPISFLVLSFLLSRLYLMLYGFFPARTSYTTDFFLLFVFLSAITASPFDLIIILSSTTSLIFFLISLRYHLGGKSMRLSRGQKMRRFKRRKMGLGNKKVEF